MVARGHARLVTEALADFQGLAVEGLGGVVVPPVLGQHAEPVAEHGVLLRAGGDPGEGFAA